MEIFSCSWGGGRRQTLLSREAGRWKHLHWMRCWFSKHPAWAKVKSGVSPERAVMGAGVSVQPRNSSLNSDSDLLKESASFSALVLLPG